MKKITCPHCGNKKGFREHMIVHRFNYFVQRHDGRVLKAMVKERTDDDTDSIIVCEVCGQELYAEVYHQLLNNYIQTIFEIS